MIWDQDMECMPRAKMQQLQAERLVDAVARAYHRVPFYREMYEVAGIRPAEVRGLDDLPRLPFVKKTDLREHYPFGLFAEPLDRVVRLHASSGTKGKPTVVGYTRQDIVTWSEVMARVFFCAGGRPGDMFQNAYGYGLFTGGLGFHYGVERAGATVIPVSGGNTPRQVLLMQDFRSSGLGCTPSYALNIADALSDAGVDPAALSLRYGIFGAEPWGDPMRARIEERLGIHAVDIYGLSEIIGPGVSCECWEAKEGLHINEDHFLPEIIHPETGEPLPAGEFGELVFTSLTREAIPMIRYRTGDITALCAEPCRCGRTTVRMSRLKGRVDDMLIIRGVNLFPSEVEYELLKMAELAPHYQLVVDRQGALDDLEVQVELADDVLRELGGFDPEREELAELRGRVDRHLRSTLGLHVAVTLMPPKTVPRSEGKAVRVIDRRRVLR